MTSKKIKTAAKPEDELVKTKFISGLRNPEAKHRRLDGIKAKPSISVTEMTESVQLRSQAMVARSSSGKRPLL